MPLGAPAVFFDIDSVVMTNYNAIETPNHLCGEGRSPTSSLLRIMQRSNVKRFCLVNALSMRSGHHYLRCYRQALDLVKRGYRMDRFWAMNTGSRRRGKLQVRHAIIRLFDPDRDLDHHENHHDNHHENHEDHQSKSIRCAISLQDINEKNKYDFPLLETGCGHVFMATAFFAYFSTLLDHAEDPLTTNGSDDAEERGPGFNKVLCPLCKTCLIDQLVNIIEFNII